MIKYKFTTQLDLGDLGFQAAEVICEIEIGKQSRAALQSAFVLFERENGQLKVDVTKLIRSTIQEDLETEAIHSFLSYGKDEMALAKEHLEDAV